MIRRIKNQVYCSKNLISMLWWKLLIIIGAKRSTKPIPKGMYCYQPDEEKNKISGDWENYYIIPCKYYKTLGRKYNGCAYRGIITDDPAFDDQCKICDENMDY